MRIETEDEMRALLLFDVNGTLVKGLGTLVKGLGPYISSLEQAVKDTFKQRVKIDLTDAHGKTDRRILREHLEERNPYDSYMNNLMG